MKSNLISLFETAKKKLINPKLTYLSPIGKIVVYPAKEASRNPGCLYVTVNGEYQGKILPDGTYFGNGLGIEINEIVNDPIKKAKLQGQQFSHCCFCNLTLTNKESIFVGYGPVCAEKWGLPYGNEREQSILGDLI